MAQLSTEKGVFTISIYAEYIFVAIGSLILLLLIQSLPIVLIGCLDPKLSLGVVSGDGLSQKYSTGGPRIWLRFVWETLFKSGQLGLVVYSDKSGLAYTRSHLVNGLCKVLIMDSLFIIALLAVIPRNLPLPYSEIQVLKGAMIVLGAMTAIFLIIVCVTGSINRAQEVIVSKVFTASDFILYAVEEKIGRGPEKTDPYISVLHRLFNVMGAPALTKWINHIDMDHYIDAFEANQREIMGKQDNPIPMDPVNRRDISSWSLWLKEFIGQSMLTDLLKTISDDSIQQLDQEEKQLLETLKDCCHILPSGAEPN